VCAVLLVIITGFYTYFAAGQLHKMRRAVVAAEGANEVARSALVSVQRAFISFSPIARIGTTVSNNKVTAWQAHVPMRNQGSTRANEVASSISHYFTPSPLSEDFSFPDQDEPLRGPLGPKDELELRTRDIPIGNIQEVQNKTGHVYVYGWATYRDVFQKTPHHVTVFCYELFPNTIQSDLTDPRYNLTGSFILCKKHNCDDEGCTKDELPKGFDPRVSD
jgi:hypothetical protein